MVMARATNWESRIGRRLRLRDLHVLFTAVQYGSMAKAALALGVSQPAVSKVITQLEDTLGVRLLDRGARGIALTMYGRALLARSNAAFDELRQSIRDIEFLADPTVGEVHIECQESIAAAILPSVIHRFSQAYPRVVVHVEHAGSLSAKSSALRERTIDAALYRVTKPRADQQYDFGDDLNAEVLFHDRLVVVAGMHSRLAHRRKVELADLVDAPWILAEPDTWNYVHLAEAFAARGLGVPKMILATLSTHLRAIWPVWAHMSRRSRTPLCAHMVIDFCLKHCL
jgi:DNA-binding transcriptional LysR family regulator